MLVNKHQLAKSNDHYRKIHPTEASVSDAALAVEVAKAQAKAKADAEAKAKAAAAKAVARLVKCVERSAERVIAELIQHYRAGGHRIVGAGIVVGSTVDPRTIRNDHIRAHAEEGRLFRVVIENALKLSRLKFSVTREKDSLGEGKKMLGVSEPGLRTELTKMGKAIEGSWRAEEKEATLAALMALARWSRGRIKS